MAVVELNGVALELTLRAWRDGDWISLPLQARDSGFNAQQSGIQSQLHFTQRDQDSITLKLNFQSPFRTRLRLAARLIDHADLFHLIPGNIHGDNNAAHVRPGEFPCLTSSRPAERNCSPLWEFRADRASHPASILCCAAGAVGLEIDPYSECDETDERFIRNGVFAELSDVFGVSLGYGNDPLTFVEKTHFRPATADHCHGASAMVRLHTFRGTGRRVSHRIVRAVHQHRRDVPRYSRTFDEALRALAQCFRDINWSAGLQQYTNRKCRVPLDTQLQAWRAIVEIGWTGGSMLAYPFALAEQIFTDLKLPKSSAHIFDEICSGWNEASGFLSDTALNAFTKNRPEGWNDSMIDGWWSGFLAQTRDNHCAYTNAHAAYYMLRTPNRMDRWAQTALRILDTAIELQREDGAFGYIFSSRERRVIDYDGFAGCWFAAALPIAWQLSGNMRYREAADRALTYYSPFVRNLACWGTPMDTFKSVDSEGNLAFIRAARLMHELTHEDRYLEMLLDGAQYEYLWRYAFRTRPQCPPLKDSSWNSCGGTITSVSNPHVHPMSVVATSDLEYLARHTNDDYHQQRADDGMAWLMNTMELYPDTMGYGRYGVLSERTCPSDGLLVERYADSGAPASTWWSYNAWAAGSAMEAIGERILGSRTMKVQR
jgi:hypothetical protein